MSNLTRQIARQLITEAAKKKTGSHPYGGKYPPAEDWDQLSEKQRKVHKKITTERPLRDRPSVDDVLEAANDPDTHPLTLHHIATRGPWSKAEKVGVAVAEHPDVWSSTLAHLVGTHGGDPAWSPKVHAAALESQNIRGDEVVHLTKHPDPSIRKRAKEILRTSEVGEYGDFADGLNY